MASGSLTTTASFCGVVLPRFYRALVNGESIIYYLEINWFFPSWFHVQITHNNYPFQLVDLLV